LERTKRLERTKLWNGRQNYGTVLLVDFDQFQAKIEHFSTNFGLSLVVFIDQSMEQCQTASKKRRLQNYFLTDDNSSRF